MADGVKDLVLQARVHARVADDVEEGDADGRGRVVGAGRDGEDALELAFGLGEAIADEGALGAGWVKLLYLSRGKGRKTYQHVLLVGRGGDEAPLDDFARQPVGGTKC